MFQNHWEQKYYIPRTQRAVTDQMVPRSASWDRKEISRDTGRDDWRVTPSSDYKPKGVVCWTGAPIPKALYHTLCWLYCQWYTHNYMLASSEPKTIIALISPDPQMDNTCKCWPQKQCQNTLNFSCQTSATFIWSFQIIWSLFKDYIKWMEMATFLALKKWFLEHRLLFFVL